MAPKIKYHYSGSEFDGLSVAKNYYSWILSEFRTAVHGTCLEVGAGIGTVSKLLLKEELDKLVCIEPAENLIGTLRERLRSEADAREGLKIAPESIEIYPLILEEFLTLSRMRFDSILCVNLLEHIKKDREAVLSLHHLLREGGEVVFSH
jgi:2-polyprenyl-3-methyl-5-hydroxy-6-metoxy-1,4-benzoquinol methylase